MEFFQYIILAMAEAKIKKIKKRGDGGIKSKIMSSNPYRCIYAVPGFQGQVRIFSLRMNRRLSSSMQVPVEFWFPFESPNYHYC